ncbi:putative lipid II flippase FtsW [Nanchangia anserum]|nr:putative lipid II flippase FtsW [Nanchangia anserum]
MFDALRRRLPVVRIEKSSGEQVHAAQRVLKPWHILTSTPGFTFYLIRTVTVLLAGIGLVMGFSASTIRELSANSNPYLAVLRPLAIVVIGLALMAIISRIPYRVIMSGAPVWLAGAILLQLTVFTPLGKEVAGNRNWISLGVTTLQPSELLKVAIVIWLAWVFHTRRVRVRNLASVGQWIIFPCIVAVAIVMVGKDLGTAMIFGLICAATLFVIGWERRWLLASSGIVVMAVAGAVAMSPSRRARVMAIFSSSSDPLGTDLQTLRAKWGLGTGGLVGVGPGASRQKWNYLPEAHTDFIFAILGEEFGFFGTVSVLILFVLLAYGLFRLVTRMKDPAVRVLAAATSGWLITQALINILVVIGWAPVVGVPLPFISSGGSSMLASFIIMGVVLACAREEPGAQKLLGTRHRRTQSAGQRARGGTRDD